jgi:hypothetical protein
MRRGTPLAPLWAWRVASGRTTPKKQSLEKEIISMKAKMQKVIDQAREKLENYGLQNLGASKARDILSALAHAKEILVRKHRGIFGS